MVPKSTSFVIPIKDKISELDQTFTTDDTIGATSLTRQKPNTLTEPLKPSQLIKPQYDIPRKKTTEIDISNIFGRKHKQKSKTDLNLKNIFEKTDQTQPCLLYTSPSPRDATLSRMPSSA